MTGITAQRARFQFNLAIRLTLVLALAAALGMAVMGVYVTRVLEAHVVESLRTGLLTEAGLMQEAVLAALAANDRPGAVQ